MDSGTRQWYLLASKRREEERAKINLERQGYKVYLPMVQRERQGARGQKRGRLEALFPQYLFIQLSSTIDSWAPIRSTFGVSGLVGFGAHKNAYPPVPEGIVEQLRAHEEEDGLHRLQTEASSMGNKVSKTNGPYRELEAVYRMDDGTHRAMALIEMLGKPQPCE
jgi:transcriptional antiterminator RfaH